MPIASTCPGCHTTFNLADNLAGKQVRCSKCQAVFTAASGAAEKATPEPPAQPEGMGIQSERRELPVSKTRPSQEDPDHKKSPSSKRKRHDEDEEDDDEGRPKRRYHDPKSDTPRSAKPPQIKKSGFPLFGLLLGGGCGLLLLLGCAGGLAAFFLWPSPAKQEVVAVAPDKNGMPDEKPVGNPIGDAVGKPGKDPVGNPGGNPGGNPNGDPDWNPGNPGGRPGRDPGWNPGKEPPGNPGKDPGGAAADNTPIVKPVNPVEIKAAKLEAEKVERKLPGTIGNVCVGGAGRFVILHLPASRQLAIFDANEAKVVKYLPLAEDNIKIAAGMDKLMVVMPDKKLIQRWSLLTFEREVTAPLEATPRVVSMGCASGGPLLLGGGADRFRGDLQFLDIQSLKILNLGMEENNRFDIRDFVRASADGSVFGTWNGGGSPQGISTLVITGRKLKSYYEHDSAGHILPSPDGRYIYTGRGIGTSEVKMLGRGERKGGYTLPAHHGPYYMSLTLGDRPGRPGGGDRAGTMSIHMAGDTRPLVTLNDVDLPTGINEWDREQISSDQRIHLIPEAKLLVTIPSTNDKLVLHRFDVDAILAKSGVDYLIVTSQPPQAARRGSTFVYPIVVKSKKGGVKYKVESGPMGMVVDANGRVNWVVPNDFRDIADVIILVSDSSGQEMFHSFKLAVNDTAEAKVPPPGPQPPLDPLVPPKDPPAEVKLPETGNPSPSGAIKPPTLDKAQVTRELPASFDAVAVGGGGRYLILRLPSKRQLAIFDANEGKVVKYLPVAEDDVKFAAGLDVLFVVNPSANVIQRYSLATFEKELTVPCPIKGPIVRALMGSASHGPLLVAGSSDNFGRGNETAFLDVKTLKNLELEAKGFSMNGFGTGMYCRVSGNGQVFSSYNPGSSPQGHTLSSVIGKTLTHHSMEAPGYGLYGHATPGADGRYVYSSQGLFTVEGKPVGKVSADGKRYAIAAAEGEVFYLNVEVAGAPHGDERQASKLFLHVVGDERPVAELTQIDLPRKINVWDREPFPNDQRAFLIPSAKMVVVLPATNDRLEVYRVDVEDLLKKSGRDFLFVTSRPPLGAKRGEAFAYPLAVKSNKGGVKVKVESGPTGMKIEANGEVKWQVPKDFEGTTANVILTVSDASGQELFHSFALTVTD